MAVLADRLTDVVGARTAAALASALDLHTVGDLLRHYPRRYAQRGELTDIAGLEIGEHVTVLARVESTTKKPMRSRKGSILEVTITDGSRRLSCAFFGNQTWRERELRPGRTGLFAGKVTAFRRSLQLANPEYELIESDVDDGVATAHDFLSRIIPVYPAAQGLPSWRISKAVHQTLEMLDREPDPLPGWLRREHGLVTLFEALHAIHRPRSDAELEGARTRLKWDEALAVQLVLARRRHSTGSGLAPACPPKSGGIAETFDERLPFRLTEGQREIGEALSADLAGEHPMNRLLQGEVGSGKTIVALRAMLQVVDAGRQAALLAPTEVLAAQHARSLRELLGDLAQAGELGGAERATRVTLLTGSLTARQRKQALLDAASGAAGIVVGTHALLGEHVSFADLAFVVIDEQHRFGVEQRDALRSRAGEDVSPHVLVMTATPIPRTVAMTVYGDLETSSLRQLPSGRSPISTTVVPSAEKPAWLDRAWQRLREEVAKGHQAYVVCPRIGDEPPSDKTERPPIAVLDLVPELENGPLAGLRVGVLHGRLPGDDKDAVMRAFAAGELDVLVATTVIEVGVNVPNATLMVIMDADRFGVSQLHQLRGRVGRGSVPGLCLLVTEALDGTSARARLAAVESTTDGFELSKLDLELRREGDILGAAQSGTRSGLKLLSLLRDEDVIARSRQVAQQVISADPDLADHPGLAALAADTIDDERAEYLEKT
ncbi:ATP-dependent DNA helicase RecG [Saccharomonospora xinjiangensis]|uniref:ATP-dependent DNA helicase RecG n=1 Tax=Saccharomonospora xinjiangensis XJ-54 TaxID=882086 RepID=I0UZL1_9PSEU|nr:ATP-dependent DNA helicase RecG [Saccharomonospora xinjiangensis]EID53314.1 ATP-dependent DNA helicase RecG [Saccharomonospora xinjiangensis XJ-54]